MFIDEIYQFTLDVLKKDQKGYASPGEFNRAFQVASDGLFKQRYGLPEAYQHGQAIPNIAYSLSQKIEDDTLPFKERYNMAIGTNGRALIPGDYSHVIAIRKNVKVSSRFCGDESYLNYQMKDVDVLTEQERSERLASVVIPVSLKRPVCTFYRGYIQFTPHNINHCEFVYLRRPERAVWAYTITNGRPVFDPVNSVDTDWPEDTHLDLKIRVIKLLAISLRENDIVAIMNQMKQEGE